MERGTIKYYVALMKARQVRRSAKTSEQITTAKNFVQLFREWANDEKTEQEFSRGFTWLFTTACILGILIILAIVSLTN